MSGGIYPRRPKNRVRQRVRKADQESAADTAHYALDALATALERDYPGAAKGLREGGAETLTGHHLRRPSVRQQTWANTNALESVNRSFRPHAPQVRP